MRLPSTIAACHTLLSIVLCAVTGLAIELSNDCRVPNAGGYCTWSCIDTLARQHGLRSLIGIRDQRRDKTKAAVDPGYESAVVGELNSRNVQYERRPQLSFQRDLLEQYAASHGVVVALKQGNPWCGGCHSIVVSGYDESRVSFYDSSRPVQNGEPKIWTCGRDWFDAWWLGDSLVLLGEWK